MEFTDQPTTYYAIKAHGVVSGRYTHQILAEQAKQQLPENDRTSAVVVPVDSNGRELLFG